MRKYEDKLAWLLRFHSAWRSGRRAIFKCEKNGSQPFMLEVCGIQALLHNRAARSHLRYDGYNVFSCIFM